MADNRLEFTFHQCLGRGGFGEVYLATVARSGGLSRQMAVKVLKQGLDNEADAVRRLRDEARLLMVLNHPAILRAHELSRVKGRIALVTEYVEGADVSTLIRNGQQGPSRAVIAIIADVADALHCAWSTPSPETGRPLHLIHRDIKPENIRVTPHGQVKLLDFGIARSTEMQRDAKTRAGDLPITPGYAAPESFSRGDQGPEADVYALGSTMFRLLVGEKLYEGVDLATQFELGCVPKLYEPWIQQRLTKLPPVPEIIELARSMLAQDPKHRPTAQQVGEITEELSQRLEGPSLAKWTRHLEFPPPGNLKNAPLNGITVREDDLPSRTEALPTQAHEIPSRSVMTAPVTPAPAEERSNTMIHTLTVRRTEAFPSMEVQSSHATRTVDAQRSTSNSTVVFVVLGLGAMILLLGLTAVAIAVGIWFSQGM